MNHNLKINKCCHFESNQDITKLPWQIYSKLPKVPFKHIKSRKNVAEFYTHLFKDLNSMLVKEDLHLTMQDMKVLVIDK